MEIAHVKTVKKAFNLKQKHTPLYDDFLSVCQTTNYVYIISFQRDYHEKKRKKCSILASLFKSTAGYWTNYTQLIRMRRTNKPNPESLISQQIKPRYFVNM